MIMKKPTLTSSGPDTSVRSKPTKWLENTPAATSIMTKMVRDHLTGDHSQGEGVKVHNETIFDHIVGNRAQKNLDAETILQLSSDLKLIKQMIISTTLSPVDMFDGELVFKTEDSEIRPTILNEITEVIREHFGDGGYYPLRDKLPEIIGEALFDYGAWIGVIVPEAVIDDIINDRTYNGVSNESAAMTDEMYAAHIASQFKDGTLKHTGKGILGDPGLTEEEAKKEKRREVSTPSMENFFWNPAGDRETPTRINDACTITDNIAVLGLGKVRDRINQKRMNRSFRSTTRISNESFSGGNGHIKEIRTLANSLYRDNGSAMERVKVMTTAAEASRSSIGHPLVIKVPSESCIPCFPKGEPRNHLGYIILLDELGHPLDVTDEIARAVKNGNNGLNGDSQMNQTSSLIQQTKMLGSGLCYDADKTNAAERVRIFDQVLEENVLNRIKNGLLGRNVKLGWNEDIMRLFLFRKFANQRTHMVFVPVENVAYFAYDYDKNGMGKSLMDDIKQVSALRAMTTFANFMAGVKNAVGRTKVTMNIDPRDPDPDKAYHVMIDEFMRQQAGGTPTDVTSAAEMFRVIRSMGVVIEVQGNPRMPNTTVDVSEFQSQRQQIDPEFSRELQRQQYMGLFVTPEMVDMTTQADFAISRWTTNQLYAKRIMMIQDDTCKHGKKFVKSYTLSDGTLVGRIQEIFREHNDQLPEEYRCNDMGNPYSLQYTDAIEEFFRVLYLELPRPESNRIENQKEEYDKVSQWIDDMVENYISPELIGPSLGDEDQDKINHLKANVAAYFKREYLAKTGMDFGLSELTRVGSEDNPAIDFSKELNAHMANLVHNLGDTAAVIRQLRENRLEVTKETNPDLSQAIENANQGGFGGGSDWGSDNSSSDSEFDTGSDEFEDFGEGDLSGNDFGSREDEFGGDRANEDPFQAAEDDNLAPP
ncbi:putative virion structural protein [Serratia phage vB_SmaM-Kodama]|nr:putative virion structural protein [Serratia phage vB_SmaM_Haymo]UQT03527.1 putative virion structural protein [Serratia phage vB_SmaM-Kodama]